MQAIKQAKTKRHIMTNTNLTIKKAIKISKILKRECELIAYNQNNYTYEKEFNYSKVLLAGDYIPSKNTFLKNLYGNKVLKDGSILISDQVVDHFFNTYNLSIREFDSFCLKSYIESFEKDIHFLNILVEKSKHIIEMYENAEKFKLASKLENSLTLKDETPARKTKI